MSSPLSFSLQKVGKPNPRPKDSELVFGRTFTDHMAIVDYSAERGWFDPRVVPYGPIALDPAAAVLHYAQEMFDGLKAFRGVDAKVRFFRIDRHCQRLHDGAEHCRKAIVAAGRIRAHAADGTDAGSGAHDVGCDRCHETIRIIPQAFIARVGPDCFRASFRILLM